VLVLTAFFLKKSGGIYLSFLKFFFLKEIFMSLTKAQVEATLKTIPFIYLDKPLSESCQIQKLEVSNDGVVQLALQFAFPILHYQRQLQAIISDALKKNQGFKELQLSLTIKIVSHAVQKQLKPLQNIKNIIAVASGKGGVGKSTTAVNLALALASDGATVGILDADIYGPSQPRMLGKIGERPDSRDNKSLEPIEAHGLQAMSIGFLIEEDTPMIWRGPMVTQALEQLLNDTRWRNLDYLIIDLPPGTGDIQLTLAQKIPVSGAIIVTTPQDIALLDAQKGLQMFEKVAVPILGIVENMSIHICSNCGHEEAIFGEGGGEKLAKKYNVEFLGALPLDKSIREQADGGKPSVIAQPNSRIAEMYRDIARRATAKLSLQSKDYSVKFPNIVIKSS
jgi:ATP-binding protein involved in chromosome partitioning